MTSKLPVHFDFDPPSPKGWSIKGAKIERINGHDRPVILYRHAKVNSVDSPTQKDLAAALRLAIERKRPEFVFLDIPDGHPLAGQQYCCYSPQWLRGTNFGKVMYEGDLAMKELTHDVRTAEDGSYVTWQSTSKLRGLRSSFDFFPIPGPAPFYLSCRSVNVSRNNNSIIFPDDPKMEIMLANNPGYWEYISSIYDNVAYHDAPELEQVKELPKLILVAEWLIENEVRINDDWLKKNTEREAALCPTVHHSPGPHSAEKNEVALLSLPDDVVAVLKAGLENIFHLMIQGELESLQNKLEDCDAQLNVPDKVDVEITDVTMTNEGKLSIEAVKSFQRNGETVRKVRSTFRAAIDDDDFVCADLSPQMPLGINHDGTLLCPDVSSWKELKSEVIFPFFGGICAQKDDGEVGWEAQQQSWGGCSMKSFVAEPRRSRPIPKGTPCGPGYTQYPNGVVGAAAGLHGEVGVACVGQPVQAAKKLPKAFEPSRDVSYSAPLAAHNEKLRRSGKGDQVFGQMNPASKTGYVQSEKSGAAVRGVKASFSKTEEVLEGPGKGSKSRQYGACCIPQLVTGNEGIMVWGSDPQDADSVTSGTDKCSICLESLKSRNLGVLECNHMYHDKVQQSQ